MRRLIIVMLGTAMAIVLLWLLPGIATAAGTVVIAEKSGHYCPLVADGDLWSDDSLAGSINPTATPTPVADVYLEGTLVWGVECVFLETAPGQTWLLLGNLQGFTVGDQVGVWGNFCPPPCITICLEGGTAGNLLVKGIVGLEPVGVGGIAELPEVAGTPQEAPDASGPSAGLLAGIAGAAAGAVALGGAAWWARRRVAGR